MRTTMVINSRGSRFAAATTTTPIDEDVVSDRSRVTDVRITRVDPAGCTRSLAERASARAPGHTIVSNRYDIAPR